MRRIAGTLVVLALLLGSGCSDSKDGSGKIGTVQARELPAIYGDILAQRDRTQKAIARGTEMWHEECAEVVAATGELETLLTELQQRVAATPDFGELARGIDSHIGLTLGVVSMLRENALQEVVGMLPGGMSQLDAYLRGLETHFTPEQLGGQSVSARPGFNPEPPKPPLSPV